MLVISDWQHTLATAECCAALVVAAVASMQQALVSCQLQVRDTKHIMLSLTAACKCLLYHTVAIGSWCKWRGTEANAKRRTPKLAARL